ncbi:hypothetical protein IH981_03670 [Patescibacteria group bacterium]|nr:hypothetical protein [Patescibacteria group bacterium]
MPNLNPFKRKPKKKDFLIVEIGLEKITCAIFEKEEPHVKLVGVGKKSFSSPEEVFDATLEALDSLAKIVPDFPTDGILGISGGSLETITTIARYSRPKPKKQISFKETEDVLHQVVADLNKEGKKIFFSTVSGATIDGVKVTNPLGLKGEKMELSCFVAFKDTNEMDLLDRLMNEIDLKIEKIIPSSFAVSKILTSKNLDDVLIFRVGADKSELTVMIDGHVSEILPVGIGGKEPQLLHLAWQVAIKKFGDGKMPDLVWLFADNDQVELEKVSALLKEYPWKTSLGFKIDPKVEIASNIQNFTPSDVGIYALSLQEFE